MFTSLELGQIALVCNSSLSFRAVACAWEGREMRFPEGAGDSVLGFTEQQWQDCGDVLHTVWLSAILQADSLPSSQALPAPLMPTCSQPGSCQGTGSEQCHHSGHI